MANYIEEDSSEAELISEDLANDIADIKQDMADEGVTIRNTLGQIQATISGLIVREWEREKESKGSDHHVEAEESPECLGGGDSYKSLDLSIVDAEVTASTGYLNLHSAGVHKEVCASDGSTIPATVSISSGDQYVYVSYARDNSANPKLAVASTYPQSTTETLNWCLAKYTDLSLVVIYHDGDINIDVPLM